MEIITLDPQQVKVREGLDRYRSDMGSLEELGNSIERTRQILPIVLTRDFELIDGGRRLAACLLKGLKVRAVYEDVKDDYEFRELELEANLHRKDFTPAEEALAIRDLHRMKEHRLGQGGSGVKEGWSIADTARLIGKTRGSVYNALEMATLVDSFPELKKAKKKSEIKRAGKALNKLTSAMEGLKRYEEAGKTENNQFWQLHNTDAVEYLPTVPSASVDILLTDPLYGIGADLIAKTIGGGVKGFTTSGFNIEDPTEAAYFYYHFLAQQSYRFCTERAHGYVFVGPEHFWKVREIFLTSGWLVHVKPLIWIKRTTGQCNIPANWPASCYEMLMYIRKPDSKLVKEGQPDWLECDPVNPNDKIHPYQKPIPLLINLLERVSLPGQTMIDPFAGSCSSIEAGLKTRLFSIGAEKDKNAFALAYKRISTLKMEVKSEEN